MNPMPARGIDRRPPVPSLPRGVGPRVKPRIPQRPSPSPPIPAPTPEDLALRAQSGSLQAFCQLVDLFEVRLFNFLLRRVGSTTDAEDLTQETFLRAWQRIGTYRSQWRFSTWLFTIGARLAVSKGRRAGGTRRTEAVRDEPPAPSDRSGVSGLEAGEERSRIWAIVDRLLTPEQRTAVWLRYVEDMAIKDIAGVMNKSQVSVRVMLFRARAALAEALSDPAPAPRPAIQPRPAPALRGAS